MLCSEASLVNSETRIGSAVTLFCRRWSCDGCAPSNKRRVKALAHAGRPTTFITLTASPQAGSTPALAADTLYRAWAQLRRELIVKLKVKRIPFMAVFESTKKARPHLHILARIPYLAQAWLSARMGALAASPIVDIRLVTNRRKAAAYVSKYLAKSPERFPGRKRFWRSLDWVVDPLDDGTPVMDRANGWQSDRRSLATLAYSLGAAQYQVWHEGAMLRFAWAWPTAPPFEREALNVQP